MFDFARTASLIAATVAMGLAAGLFAGFSYSVMPGLARTDDRTFVTTMQNINSAILNGWFMTIFIGALLLTAVAGVVHLRGPDRSALVWIGAAFVLYLATFLITGMVNVPLNDQLAAAGGVDQITDLAAIRERFEATWVRWNLIRAVTSTIGFGLLTWGLVLHGRGTG